jgi:glycosyltransferase involved in cell wall biosynthesis
MPGHGTSVEALNELRKMNIETMLLNGSSPSPGLRQWAKLLGSRWGKPDVFISMGMRHWSPVFAMLLRPKRSLYYHITHDLEHTTRRMLRFYSRFFSSIIFISPATEREWIRQVGPNRRTFSVVQPSSISFEMTETDNEEATVRFGFIGRLNQGKGCDLLVRFVKECHVDCSLRVAGAGEFDQVFTELANDSDYRVKVRFDGPFNPSQRVKYLSDFMGSIDYLVVPSQDELEGIPTVILEALSAGVPVIASRSGGMRAFEYSDFGWSNSPCVRLFAAASLDKVLESLALGGRPEEALRANCRAYHEARFSDGAVYKAWHRVLLESDPV